MALQTNAAADQLSEEFGTAYRDAAEAAVEAADSAVRLLSGADLSNLSKTNYSCLTFDWEKYLRASCWRVVQLVKALRERGLARGSVLDQGALFGNFSLALKRLGYEPTASDYYACNGAAMAPWTAMLKDAGVRVVECGQFGQPLPYQDKSFDVVLSLSVIEHIPSTPRHHLLDMARCLKDGGLFVLETPNLAYQFKRQELQGGRTVFFPIADQFESRYPFSGHHREYTRAEVEWMMARIGMECLRTDLLDYSWRTVANAEPAFLADVDFRSKNPDQRELVICTGTKARHIIESDGAAEPKIADVRTTEPGFEASTIPLLQKEVFELRQRVVELSKENGELFSNCRTRDEMLLAVQKEVDRRDEMLRQLQSDFNNMQAEYWKALEKLKGAQENGGAGAAPARDASASNSALGRIYSKLFQRRE